MRLYVIIGMKSVEVGTKKEYVPTGRMRPPEYLEPGYGEGGGAFGGDMPVPETKEVTVPWFKELPHLYGVYSYDPIEKHRDMIIKNRARVFYFDEDDVEDFDVDYII